MLTDGRTDGQTDGRTDKHHQSISRNCFAIPPKKEQYTISMNMHDKQVNCNNNKILTGLDVSFVMGQGGSPSGYLMSG